MGAVRISLLLMICCILIKENASLPNPDVQNFIRDLTRKKNRLFKPPPPKDITKPQKSAEQYAIENFQNRKPGWCTGINNLLHKKTLAVKRIDDAINQITMNKTMLLAEKNYHVARFHVMQKELNETEGMVVSSFNWLQETLNDDYNDIINMKEFTKKRLDLLRDATLREEQEYNTLLKAEEQLKNLNHTKVHGMVEDLLHDVALAADRLEHDLDDHVFDDAVHNPDLAKGENIEAVIRIEDEEKIETHDNSSHTHDKDSVGVIKLVDVQDNQFVLSKGKDSTVPHEDHHLIEDVVYLMMLSFILGWLCSLLGLPSMFGYILTGVILGPSGGNLLKSLVQVETFGEFGVFFILFSVGLEFSPEKIKKVFKVSLLGGGLMMLLMVVCGLGASLLINSKPAEGAFVAACLSLSSTPLVVKFLSPTGDNNGQNAGGADYGTILLGILIIQDVLLGVLMALLPNMAGGEHNNGDDQSNTGYKMYFMIGLKLFCALVIVIVVCVVSSYLIIKYLFTRLVKNFSKEIVVLASITTMFLMMLLTDCVHVSMELGCFLGGVMISAQGSELSEKIEHIIQPIKDFLGCIFFVSIGLHVFPSFMVYEMTYLITFTVLTVSFKFIISVIVLTVVLPRSSKSVKWIVSAGLAQVSEFSFVLGSRARRLGLISREVYLLILSVTTLSLLMAPFVWKAALWQRRIKPNRSHSDVDKVPRRRREHKSSEDIHADAEDFVILSTLDNNHKKRRTVSK